MSTYRAFITPLPQNLSLGTKFRCLVLSIGFDSNSNTPGISRNTVNSEHTMLFASTAPRSSPSRSCMNMSATSPDTVVSELDAISGIAFASAAVIAPF